MTFDSSYPRGCLSSFSTAFAAYAPLSLTDAIGDPVYQSINTDSKSDGFFVLSTDTSITTLASGLAVAGNVVVGWQIDDFKSFPSEYATSLAKRINITLPVSTATSNRLRPGVIAGISVGVGLGVVIIGLVVTLLYLRKRRKATSTMTENSGPHEMEDQDETFRQHRFFFGGRWRTEVEPINSHRELDSKTIVAVPGPPSELYGSQVNVSELPATSHPTDVKHGQTGDTPRPL